MQANVRYFNEKFEKTKLFFGINMLDVFWYPLLLPQTVARFIYCSNGTIYPPVNGVRIPRRTKEVLVYSPKLEYFARIYNFPFDPARAATAVRSGDYYMKYILKLGCTIPGYCGKWNANDPCDEAECIYYHLCEWCAMDNHIGNYCPYRPDVAPRKMSKRKKGNQANNRNRR